MVKIINQFGDVKKGKQHTVVYQDHYGNQMRRMLKENKDEHTRGQLEQRERFKTGIYFAKSLTKAQKDFIKSYMTEAGIRSPDGLPTTWYSFVKKIAMTRPKVEMETESGEEGFSGTYAAWNYRKPITISNSGTAQSNFQVLITLTTENFDYSKCKNDGGDIRFAASDSSTPLSYWVEDWNYNGTSKLWVKVNSIPGGNSTIYTYYGNESATSESNADNTFIQYHGSATATYLDSLVTEENQDLYYRSKLKIATGTHNIVFGIQNQANLADDTLTFQSYTAPNLRYITAQNEGTPTTHNETPHLGDNTYKIAEMKFVSGTELKGYIDGDAISTPITTNLPNESMGLSIWVINGSITQDWSFIAKYAPSMPTYDLGEEETGGVPATLKTLSIHHPAIKSFQVYHDDIPVLGQQGISNLENHIATVITQTDLNISASKIIVKTLANQEYEFEIK